MVRREDGFWSAFLGINPGDWAVPGSSFRPHVGLSGYNGFWCFRRHDRVLVSAPPLWLEQLQLIFAGWDADRLMTPAALAEALGANVERTIGPAFQGHLPPERFVARQHARVRELLPEDSQALARFQKECGAKAWDDAGLSDAERWRTACFEGEHIVALAGYRRRGELAGDPCVLTHPGYRSGGRGAAVVSAVLTQALASGELVLYQTLESNQAAVKLALALGYERYATHVAVRLKGGAPQQ